MHINELVGVPDGKKITQKMFSRVLVSSICGILLCMACLVSATWAWFTVSLENEDNEIVIAAVTPTVKITAGDTEVSPNDYGKYTLDTGTYNIHIELENDASIHDDLNRSRGNVYVVMTVNNHENYFFEFVGDSDENEPKGFTINNESAKVSVSFSVSWVKPASATSVGDSEAVVIGEVQTESSTETNVEEQNNTSTETNTEGQSDAPDVTQTEEQVETPADPQTDPTTEEETDISTYDSADSET